jgi:hypothetical protein
MIGNAPHFCCQTPLDSQDPHSYITSEKAMHYQFNPFKKSTGGGVEGTDEEKFAPPHITAQERDIRIKYLLQESI